MPATRARSKSKSRSKPRKSRSRTKPRRKSRAPRTRSRRAKTTTKKRKRLTKKQRNRKGPMQSANKANAWDVKMGRDGRMWRIAAAQRGGKHYQRWVPVKNDA